MAHYPIGSIGKIDVSGFVFDAVCTRDDERGRVFSGGWLLEACKLLPLEQRQALIRYVELHGEGVCCG